MILHGELERHLEHMLQVRPAGPDRDVLEALVTEVGRLRNVLCEANNHWRHEFTDEIERASDKLFSKLAAHRTKPFG